MASKDFPSETKAKKQEFQKEIQREKKVKMKTTNMKQRLIFDQFSPIEFAIYVLQFTTSKKGVRMCVYIFKTYDQFFSIIYYEALYGIHK